MLVQAIRALLTCTLALLSGCSLSLIGTGDPAPAVRYYDIVLETPVSVRTARWLQECILLVEEFSAPEKYDRRLFCRLPSGRVSVLEHDRWMQAPGPLLSDAFHAALSESDVFRHVVNSRSGMTPDLRLSGTVLVFEEHASSPGARTAVLRIAFALERESASRPLQGGDTGRAPGAQMLWHKVITCREPVPGDSSAAFAAAMAEAAQAALGAMLKDLTALPHE